MERFEVLERLGAGGMGEVYRARDTKLNRFVALKFLPADASRAARDRFAREAQAVAALNHPHICVLHESGEDETGRAFLVLELLEGETLQARLARGPLSGEPLFTAAREVAEALAAAHQRSILHRDLKPGNIWVLPSGHIKILDFGLARLTGEAFSDAATVAGDALTSPGTAIGTAPYMSPEQARGEALDARSDIFSFGIVLYEMASGKPAFKRSSAAETFAAVLSAQPDLTPLPPELARIVARCLEKNPGLRYQSAADLAIELQRLQWRGEAAATAPGSRRWLWVLAVVIVAGALSYWRWGVHPPPKLTAQDAVIVAAFDNSTGNPVFDGALRQGLLAQLEQSPLLKLTSDERIAHTLALMGQPPQAHLTGALSQQVCEREGGAATIEGSIARLGTEYVLGLKALECANGDLLAEEQATAANQDTVLTALGQVATALRARLGESLASVQKYSAPAEDVTTSSLQALHAYSLGVREVSGPNDYATAIPFFQSAVTIDPNFAMAWVQLGGSYQPLGALGPAAAALRHAYALRQHSTAAERLAITDGYYMLSEQDLDQTRSLAEVWAKLYPRDDSPPTDAWVADVQTGEYPDALVDSEEAMRRNPLSSNDVVSVAYSQMFLGQLAASVLTMRTAAQHQVTSAWYPMILYTDAFAMHDAAGMNAALAQAHRTKAMADAVLFLQAETAASHGQWAASRSLAQQASSVASTAGETEIAAAYLAHNALEQALAGQTAAARVEAQAALAGAGERAQGYDAIAFALLGDRTEAARLEATLRRQWPQSTLVRNLYAPLIDAAGDLHDHQPAAAVTALEAAAPYDLAEGNEIFTFALYPAYLRGLAYLAEGNKAAAAAQFQEIVRHPGVVQNEPIGALARARLQ